MSKAVRLGTLSKSLTPDGRKIADPELADREWSENTDLTKAPGHVRDASIAEDAARRARNYDPTMGGHPNGVISPLAAASAREKQARAQLVELELAHKAGKLLLASDVEADLTTTFGTFKDVMLSIPSKMKGRCPDLTHTHLAVFQDEIANALEALVRMLTAMAAKVKVAS